ncbi:MAG: enoyl-CoA hydratase/isomerase family protein [Acidimicrobiia bacterium]
MTEPSLVRVERAGPVADLVLDRPDKKNALSIALRDEVTGVLGRLADDPELKVVTITGAGTTFSAGFDLGEFADGSPEHQARLWESSDRFHHAVLRFPLPTIAAVNGAALAGGFDLACMADLRVATPEARFGHPEHEWAPVLYRLLHDLVGGAAARDLVLTGRSVDAAEALRIGLVAAVVEPDELAAAVRARAEQIAVAPREALVATKAKIVDALGIPADARTLEL